MRRAWGIGAALACAVVAACDQAPKEATDEPVPLDPVLLSAGVDKAVVTTGDVITYTVELNHAPDVQVRLPEPGAKIAGFRIIDLGSEPNKILKDGRVLERRWYKLRADLVGSYVLPTITATYRLPDAEPVELTTSEIFVEVASVLAEGDELGDIRGLKPLRQLEREPPWRLLIAAGVGALVMLILSLVYFRRKRPDINLPTIPPHEIAFAALNNLRGTDFDNDEAVHRFYFQLSEVVRRYMEGRFGINATDLTTQEIGARIGEVHELGAADRQDITTFLVETDQVKFANVRPNHDAIASAYERALSFVENTQPRPTQVEAA